MKAIIIQDHDARALLEQLELESMKLNQRGVAWTRENATKGELIDGIHRQFHYIVTRWLQEQGASVVR